MQQKYLAFEACVAGVEIPEHVFEHKLSLRRESVLPIDDRVELSEFELEVVRAQIQNRIFERGINSSGQQMAPAKSYKSPRGLYRYLTGDLSKSIKVTQPSRGRLVMEWNYSDLIMAVLEQRYGIMFTWSKTDMDFVDDLISDILRDMGIDKTSVNRRNEERQRGLQNEIEALEIQRSNIEKLLKKDAPTEIVPDETIRQEDYVLFYDKNARLNRADILSIQAEVRNRIRTRNRMSNNSAIPEALSEFIDDKTLESIRIVKTVPGQLSIRVRYYSKTLYARELLIGQVFNWSPTDVYFVDNIVKKRLSNENKIQVIPTRKKS